ncbi:MAG TPA: uracil-DNA glycosylase family protein [Chryseosolibacter sp.]|nr:uracil-DNA glycosylase family protein [Chryseosolibacter sp.]
MTFGEKVLAFYSNLQLDGPLPKGVEVMNPYQDKTCLRVCRAFYKRYYDDTRERFLVLGINPGRYGAGLTGIPFTDPVKLESVFGIQNTFPKRPELSADFIHQVIRAFGGYEEFFSRFFINSVSPLGFVSEGRNLNYYDTPALQKSLEPFIIKSIKSQLKIGIKREIAFCLGEGDNYRFLHMINEREKFFAKIIPLAHPRFVMQYKRKKVQHYINDYLEKLNSIA